MESLKLKKFQDDKIKYQDLRTISGGGGSSGRESCSTGNFWNRDEIINIYSDPCNDGVYYFVGSVRVGLN